MTAFLSERRKRIDRVVRVSCGNFLEMYDFMVFGYYAAAIGAAFFPSGNSSVSLMASLMTFGAGFSCGRSARSFSVPMPTVTAVAPD